MSKAKQIYVKEQITELKGLLANRSVTILESVVAISFLSLILTFDTAS